MCLVGTTQLYQQVTLEFFAAGQERLVGITCEQLQRIIRLVLCSQYPSQTLTGDFAQCVAGRFIGNRFQFSRGVIELAVVDRYLRSEEHTSELQSHHDL